MKRNTQPAQVKKPSRSHYYGWVTGVFLTLFILLMGISEQQVNAKPLGSDDGYSLVDVVNSYRASNGLYALSYDGKLMAAAQAHADWIVETGNGGHTGAGGSDETVRAMWAGYGNGATIHCDEAWASTDSAESAVYSAWSDWIHQAVMLDYWGNGYTDAGGGVAKNGNGSYVFVFDLCMVSGKPASNAPTAVNTPAYDSNGIIIAPTADLSQFIMSVKIEPAAADGSITHTVDYGQTLVQIALAYGVRVAEIRELNYMAEDSTLIYPEQKLLIKAATSKINKVATGTLESTTEPGESPKPTGEGPTLAPSFTPRVRPTKTATITPIEILMTPTSLPQPASGTDIKSVGIILVVVSLIGLAAFLLFGSRRPPQKPERFEEIDFPDEK